MKTISKILVLVFLTLIGCIGWSDLAKAAPNGECHRGYFPCQEDCCQKGFQFCNQEQERCQHCDTRHVQCGTPDVHQNCLLYCERQATTTTTSVATTTISVSTTTTPTSSTETEGPDQYHLVIPLQRVGTVVLGVLAILGLFSCCSVLYYRRQRRGMHRPLWLKRIICKIDLCQSAGFPQSEAGDSTHTELSQLDHSLREDDVDSSTTPFMIRTPSNATDTGQATDDVIQDPSVLQAIASRSSSSSKMLSGQDSGVAPAAAERPGTVDERQGFEAAQPLNGREVTGGSGPGGSRHASKGTKHSPSPNYTTGGQGHPSRPESGSRLTHSQTRGNDGSSDQHGAQNYNQSVHINMYGVHMPGATHPNGDRSGFDPGCGHFTGPGPASGDHNVSEPNSLRGNGTKPAQTGTAGRPDVDNGNHSGQCSDLRLYTNPTTGVLEHRPEVAPGVDNPARQYARITSS